MRPPKMPYLGAGIADGSVFGKLTGLNNKKEAEPFDAKDAATFITRIKGYLGQDVEDIDEADIDSIDVYMGSLESNAKKSNANIAFIDTASRAVKSFTRDMQDHIDSMEDIQECQCNIEYGTTRIKGNTYCSTKCAGLKGYNNTNVEKALESSKKSAITALDDLQVALNAVDGEEKEKKDLTPVWSALGTVVLGTAGGLLVNKATRDIQQSNLDAAEKAAYEEFMNKVGSHIKCYIGAEEAGQYGDILSLLVFHPPPISWATYPRDENAPMPTAPRPRANPVCVGGIQAGGVALRATGGGDTSN